MTQQVRVNDVTFSVETAGSGRPIVLIHGWTMSGRFFQRQVPELSESFQVIVPDLRGHGASEKVLSGHTVPQYAADLHAILAELSVERPVLVDGRDGRL
jgi:pimeloyl-ACP methyl ester carboxylesterase